MSKNWDMTYMVWARCKAKKSKDPSTQVSALIVRPDHTEASFGYNGFARGVEDTPERLSNRDLKYPLTVHAELNAITNARESLKGYTLYCTHMPCVSCASAIIQAGISRVVCEEPTEDMISRWGDSFALTGTIFKEAGVVCEQVETFDVYEHAATMGIYFGERLT